MSKRKTHIILINILYIIFKILKNIYYHILLLIYIIYNDIYLLRLTAITSKPSFAKARQQDAPVASPAPNTTATFFDEAVEPAVNFLANNGVFTVLKNTLDMLLVFL